MLYHINVNIIYFIYELFDLNKPKFVQIIILSRKKVNIIYELFIEKLCL